VATSPSLGQYLTDSTGMTLYVFSEDTPDASACTDLCPNTWMPFQPPAGSLSVPAGVSGTLAVMTLPDGSQQVTYNHRPLYTFLGDADPGDAEGQNIASFGGTWTVATP